MAARWGGGRYGSKVRWGRVWQQGEVGEGWLALAIGKPNQLHRLRKAIMVPNQGHKTLLEN